MVVGRKRTSRMPRWHWLSMKIVIDVPLWRSERATDCIKFCMCSVFLTRIQSKKWFRLGPYVVRRNDPTPLIPAFIRQSWNSLGSGFSRISPISRFFATETSTATFVLVCGWRNVPRALTLVVEFSFYTIPFILSYRCKTPHEILPARLSSNWVLVFLRTMPYLARSRIQ